MPLLCSAVVMAGASYHADVPNLFNQLVSTYCFLAVIVFLRSGI